MYFAKMQYEKGERGCMLITSTRRISNLLGCLAICIVICYGGQISASGSAFAILNRYRFKDQFILPFQFKLSPYSYIFKFTFDLGRHFDKRGENIPSIKYFFNLNFFCFYNTGHFIFMWVHNKEFGSFENFFKYELRINKKVKGNKYNFYSPLERKAKTQNHFLQ